MSARGATNRHTQAEIPKLVAIDAARQTAILKEGTAAFSADDDQVTNSTDMANRSATFLDQLNGNELTIAIGVAVYDNAMVRPIETPSLTTQW